MLSSTCLALIWSLSFNVTFATSQTDTKSHHFAALSRTQFEAGYNYQPEAVGTAQIACKARNWYAAMDWGDGTKPEALSHDVAPEHGEIGPGTYSLFSRHRYLIIGSFEGSLKLAVQCVGKPDEVVSHENLRIEVFGHIPIKLFESEPETVRRGSPVAIRLELAAVAPKSGTRIFLKYSDGIGAFQSSLLPTFLEVPPGSSQVQQKIPTLRTASIGTVVITAIGANGPHKIEIKIR